MAASGKFGVLALFGVCTVCFNELKFKLPAALSQL